VSTPQPATASWASTTGWVCDCEQRYWCTAACSAPFDGHQCAPATPPHPHPRPRPRPHLPPPPHPYPYSQEGDSGPGCLPRPCHQPRPQMPLPAATSCYQPLHQPSATSHDHDHHGDHHPQLNDPRAGPSCLGAIYWEHRGPGETPCTGRMRAARLFWGHVRTRITLINHKSIAMPEAIVRQEIACDKGKPFEVRHALEREFRTNRPICDAQDEGRGTRLRRSRRHQCWQ
jgi:hypothetical protein